ncbi:MAG: hypothetical protein ACREFR_08670 [Limisphaerales bacterium]
MKKPRIQLVGVAHKMKRQVEHPYWLPNATEAVELFFDGTSERRDSVQED